MQNGEQALFYWGLYYIYIYAFSRRFYPKLFKLNSGYTFLSVCMYVFLYACMCNRANET